jgi:tagaturonate reductase
VALIQSYHTRFGRVPVNMAIGMAGHILFMRNERKGNSFFGNIKGEPYEVKDDNAAVYAEAWDAHDLHETVRLVLSNEIWGSDLNDLPEFTDKVAFWLEQMMNHGIHETLTAAENQKMKLVHEK